MKDVSVFDDLTLQGRLFQIDGAASEKDLLPDECVCTEGTQRMEVSEERCIAGGLVCKLEGVWSNSG